MAVKIALVNKKGGVGKTTSAINIADVLIHRKKKVLLIDLDPQHNATKTYGAVFDGVSTVYDVLSGEGTAEEAIQHTAFGDIIAGDEILSTEETMFQNKIGREQLLKKGIRSIEDRYDYIIMDTPPNTGVYMLNALTAADGCIIPINCDDYAVSGLSQILSVIRDVIENVNEKLRIYGVLLVAYDKRNALDRSILDLLPEQGKKSDFPVFKTPIRTCVEVRAAKSGKRSLIETSPKCNAALDYKAVVKELLKEIG